MVAGKLKLALFGTRPPTKGEDSGIVKTVDAQLGNSITKQL